MCQNSECVRSLYKLLSSYGDRHIYNIFKHLRWHLLQQEQCLSGGGNTRKRGPAGKHFGNFSPRYS